MVISRKKCPPVLQLTLCGSILEQVAEFRYFGVPISEDLSWKTHVAGVCWSEEDVGLPL